MTLDFAAPPSKPMRPKDVTGYNIRQPSAIHCGANGLLRLSGLFGLFGLLRLSGLFRLFRLFGPFGLNKILPDSAQAERASPGSKSRRIEAPPRSRSEKRRRPEIT